MEKIETNDFKKNCEINENLLKDKEYEFNIGYGEASGSIKIKNSNNRVFATIGDIMVDSLSYFRWKNAVKFLDKYNIKKQKRKLDGKETPLPPKFIIEILNNAFQEDDEELQNKWNDLLINWQDLEKNCDKKYMYIELLKNLGLNEIRLLKLLNSEPSFEEEKRNPNYYYDGIKIKRVMNLSDEEYELMILNLYRLKICDSLKSSGNSIMLGELPVLADAGIEKFRITIIGYNLIKGLED